MSKPRKSISKKLRFEVFKRDSFKCQYCGRSAPEIVLRADHIEPHSKGGSDNITNLITSCLDCNSGKGATRLSDQSLLEKTKVQLDALQEERSQLEMMMKWRRELVAVENQAPGMAAKFLCELIPGYTVNESGLRILKGWIKTFSFEEVIAAIQTAVDSYAKTNENGKATQESVDLAWSKIPGICRTERREKENPGIRDVYYIRGILRNKFHIDPYRQHLMVAEIQKAVAVMGLDRVRAIAQSARSYWAFEKEIGA